VPLETLQDVTAQSGEVSFFFVKVDSAAQGGEVAPALERRFEGYKVTALESFTEAMRENALGLEEFVRVLSIWRCSSAFWSFSWPCTPR
jgi:hypothetical protein